MTPQQKVKFEEWFLKLNESRKDLPHEYEFHHGDCVGADADAHKIVWKYAARSIQVHPPTDDRWRARCIAAVVYQPEPYPVRNRAIVEASEVLIAVPDHPREKARGGTWMTVRIARALGKPIVFIMPDGLVCRDQERLL